MFSEFKGVFIAIAIAAIAIGIAAHREAKLQEQKLIQERKDNPNYWDKSVRPKVIVVPATSPAPVHSGPWYKCIDPDCDNLFTGGGGNLAQYCHKHDPMFLTK